MLDWSAASKQHWLNSNQVAIRSLSFLNLSLVNPPRLDPRLAGANTFLYLPVNHVERVKYFFLLLFVHINIHLVVYNLVLCTVMIIFNSSVGMKSTKKANTILS